MAFAIPRLPAHLAAFAAKKSVKGQGTERAKSATSFIDDLSAMKDGSQIIPKSEVIVGSGPKVQASSGVIDNLFASVSRDTPPPKKPRAKKVPGGSAKPRIRKARPAKKT